MSRKRELNIQQEQFRCRGAMLSLQQLLDQRHIAKALELYLQSRSRLGMSGSHISKSKGRGVDFEEHRAYQAGDDIRSIDWRVTARTGRPFTKIFREERERPVIIGVDQSHHMFFGSQVSFKSVVAAEVAAILCWLTVDNGDRVGGVVFSDTNSEMVKPRRGKRSALRFLSLLADYNQNLLGQHKPLAKTGKSNLREALEHIYRITRPGSTIYLISDFADMDKVCLQYMQQLSLHNNLTCIFIYDILETQLPQPGVYNITNGNEMETIDTYAAAVRENYHQAFEDKLHSLHAELNLIKVPLISLRTDQIVLEQLETWNQKTL
ncbi:MAG: DUF58 domain-containing protein [Pseudohongiellaceae bacterium]